MRTFITIHQGTKPGGAVPVLATEDPDVVEATLSAVARRLGVHLGERHEPSLGLVRPGSHKAAPAPQAPAKVT